MRPIFITLMVLLSLVLGSVGAFAAEDLKKGPVVQILPFAAPAELKNGARRTLPVTLFLELVSEDDADEVCRAYPRIRDAVLGVLSLRPIPVRKSLLNFDGYPHPLRVAINRVLPSASIRQVHIRQGNILIGSGTSTRIGAFQGCARVRDFHSK